MNPITVEHVIENSQKDSFNWVVDPAKLTAILNQIIERLPEEDITKLTVQGAGGFNPEKKVTDCPYCLAPYQMSDPNYHKGCNPEKEPEALWISELKERFGTGWTISPAFIDFIQQEKNRSYEEGRYFERGDLLTSDAAYDRGRKEGRKEVVAEVFRFFIRHPDKVDKETTEFFARLNKEI